MEELTYKLKISTEESNYEIVSSIVELYPLDYKKGWSYDIIYDERSENYDVIARLLDSLEGKYEKLHKIGIKNSDISIWIIYGFNNQCNMEFEPELLERLGGRGIKLCISCYEAGE